MSGYEIGLTPSILASHGELGERARSHVPEANENVHDVHPSVRVHKLEGIPWVAFGVNQDAIRVICHREAQTVVLCQVGKHDPAYEPAATRGREAGVRSRRPAKNGQPAKGTCSSSPARTTGDSRRSSSREVARPVDSGGTTSRVTTMPWSSARCVAPKASKPLAS